MGCLCSKGYSKAANNDFAAPIDKDKEKVESKSTMHGGGGTHHQEGVGSQSHFGSRPNKTTLLETKNSYNSVLPRTNDDDDDDEHLMKMKNNDEEVKQGHHIHIRRINVSEAVGWPPWLASVVGEAIQGWAPRTSDSYHKLRKIGQGTYGSVYMARDTINDKIVAMKKVRFVQMDPGSVSFMAREIYILRRLDHPNIMKLQALALSKVSGTLYLVFDYMEHDLCGLLASPSIKFTEPQIKCYMQQILRGLEYCHSHGVLHRDMKGSNLLVDNKGNLKIGDFGLATCFERDQKQRRPLTSRVVTLWYRAPELLLGATDYGPEIDLWSTGCILAELFVGKPIMPGRTEVEQLHKILKLCGSPKEEYWMKVKTSFKCPEQMFQYKRRVGDAFKEFPSSALALVQVLLSMDPQERGTASSALKTQFFTSNPLPCDPSTLPHYHPSKEMDARRITDAKATRQNDGSNSSVEGDDGSRKKAIGIGIPQAEGQSNKSNGGGYKYNPMLTGEDRTRSCQLPQLIQPHLSYHHPKAAKDDSPATASGDGGKGERHKILFSGPLMPRSNLVEDMLKKHERQIQEAVRKAQRTTRQTRLLQ